MKAEEKILQYIEEFLKGSNLFLVEFKILPRNKAMIILDGDEGVKIEDCQVKQIYLS